MRKIGILLFALALGGSANVQAQSLKDLYPADAEVVVTPLPFAWEKCTPYLDPVVEFTWGKGKGLPLFSYSDLNGTVQNTKDGEFTHVFRHFDLPAKGCEVLAVAVERSHNIRHLLQRRRRMKRIAGIKKNQIAAGCRNDAFVHGVVKSFVGFGKNPQTANAAIAHKRDRIVARCAVDDNMLIVGKSLSGHASQCGRKFGRGIKRDCHDTEKRLHKLHSNSFMQNYNISRRETTIVFLLPANRRKIRP